MGYSEIKRFELQNASFIAAYEDETDHYTNLARSAYDHIHQQISTPLHDDVSPTLALMLEIDDIFRQVMSDKSKRARYWREYFADLVLHNQWVNLTGV